MIEARNLSGGTVGAASVNQISFRWNNGGVYGVVGEADASTLLALLSGALVPSAGTVKLNGFDLYAEPARAQALIGYLPADFTPDDALTPAEYLLFIADAKGMEYHQALRRVQALLERADLDGVRNTLIRKLSPAKQRMLGIAQALLGTSAFVLLDSPLSGLSVRDAQRVRDWIAEIGNEKTVLITARSHAEARELCDTVLCLQNGRMATVLDEEANTPTPVTDAPAARETPQTPPKKKSRWRLLTDTAQAYEEIDDEKENRR